MIIKLVSVQQRVTHNYPSLKRRQKIISRYKVATAIFHSKICERDLLKLLYRFSNCVVIELQSELNKIRGAMRIVVFAT